MTSHCACPRFGVFRRVLVTIVGLVLLCSGAASAQDGGSRSAGRWPVVYSADEEGTSGVVRLSLTSNSAAEVLDRGETVPAKGSWRVIQGPVIRFKGKGPRVLWFAVGLGAVTEMSSKTRMPIARGEEWHEKTAADRSKQGLPPLNVGPSQESFISYPGGETDWLGADRSIVAAARRDLPGGAFELKFADGTVRRFERDGINWLETATGKRFYSPEEQEARNACRDNLSSLVGTYIAEISNVANLRQPLLIGVALPLSFRSSKGLIPQGKESVFRCPRDPHLRPLDAAGRQAYAIVDLESPPLDLCSYAFRDFVKFKSDPTSDVPDIIACDRQGRDGKTPHHADGICVAFEDGTTRFMTRKALGLGADEPIVVGPDSKSALLRRVCQLPDR